MYRHLTPQERMDRIARLLLRAMARDDRWPDADEHAPGLGRPPDDDSNGERPSPSQRGDDRRTT